MSEELEAAQAVERFLKMVEGLTRAAPMLRQIGSIKQVAEEAEKRTAATKEEHDRLLNDLKTLRSETSRLREESEAGLSTAKREADEYLSETQKQVTRALTEAKQKTANMIAEAEKKIEKMNADAERVRQVTLTEMKQQVHEKTIHLETVTRDFAAAQSKLKQTEGQLAQLRKMFAEPVEE